MQGIRFSCPPGTHNDLATAFYTTDDELLSRLFSVGQDFRGDTEVDQPGFSHRSLAIYTVLYLAMMALACGVCVPAGLFMPAIMLGASAGLNAGLWLREWLPPSWHIQPGVPRGRCLWHLSAWSPKCWDRLTAASVCLHIVFGIGAVSDRSI